MEVFRKLLIVLVAYPACIAVFLWGIQKLLLYWNKSTKSHKKVMFYSNLGSEIVWTLVALHIFYILALIDYWLVLWGVGLLFLGRQFAQNFLSGIFFRLERGDLQGSSISIDGKEGIIIDYKLTKLCLKMVNGNCVYIPYEELYRKGFTRQVKTERAEVQSIKLYLNDKQRITEEDINLLRKRILLNPYIAVNEKLHLVKGEENGKKWLQITYVLANPERAESVKEELEQLVLAISKEEC